MHLFYDSTLNTWKLITEKLPEKPDPKDYTVDHTVPNNKYHRARMEYDAAIAALKQNALTVWNPDRIEDVFDVYKIINNISKEEFHEWPGGYKKCLSNVCLLTLPEEKKNTMENNEEWRASPKPKKPLNEVLDSLSNKMKDYSKAQRVIKDENGLPIGFEPINKPETSSGSVAAPKEEQETTLGVGDGSGQHFVHGSYDTIKLLQGKLLRMEKVESELASLRQQLAEHKDLLDRAYWYMKSNPPDKTKMSYNEWGAIISRAKAILDKR